MNQGKWDSLPDDIKAAFKDASGREWWDEVGNVWRAGDDFGIKMAEDSGREHIMLSEEETNAFITALEPVQDRWIEEVTAKGMDGAALVEMAKETIAENTDK